MVELPFYSGIFEVNCSKDIKIQGIIGPCASLDKVQARHFWKFCFIKLYLDVDDWRLCAERSIGLRKCHWSRKHNCMEDVRPWQNYVVMLILWYCQKGEPWCYCSISKQLVLLPVFDIVCTSAHFVAFCPALHSWIPNSSKILLSSYQHSSGQMRLRATTISRRWVAGPGSVQVSSAILLRLFCINVACQLLRYVIQKLSCLFECKYYTLPHHCTGRWGGCVVHIPFFFISPVTSQIFLGLSSNVGL